MGQNATIAYQHADGSIDLTSVQWCSYLDATLGFVEAEGRKHGRSGDAIATIAAITDRHSFVAAVQPNTPDTPTSGKREVIGEVVVDGLGNREAVVQRKFPNRGVIPGGLFEWELDFASVGVLAVEGKDELLFFWRDENEFETVHTRHVSLDALIEGTHAGEGLLRMWPGRERVSEGLTAEEFAATQVA